MDIKVTIDKRTELLAILILIGNYKDKFERRITPNNAKDYFDKIHEYFDKFAEHKCVLLFNQIVKEYNFGFDAPPALFLQLNKDFSFNDQILTNYPFVDRLKKAPIVIEMLKGLKEFARDIKFNKWYKENLKMYDFCINEVKEKLGKRDFFGFLKKIYKESLESKEFIVNLLPVESNGGYGIVLEINSFLI